MDFSWSLLTNCSTFAEVMEGSVGWPSRGDEYPCASPCLPRKALPGGKESTLPPSCLFRMWEIQGQSQVQSVLLDHLCCSFQRKKTGILCPGP